MNFQPKVQYVQCHFNITYISVLILYHQSTIQRKYQAKMHIHAASQTCAVLSVDKQIMRTGDRGLVRFQFMQRPEWIREGQRILFREGSFKDSYT